MIDWPRVKRHWVPLLPAAVSLLLSATTVGPHLYWQDSGFFLVAIRDLGILYPTGFALYEILCKAWTQLLFFLDFTLAVHLFSAACAAMAAGTLAQAARELLRSRGPLFRTADEGDPGTGIDAAAAVVGCLAACGYTFWAAAILAKVYAFYYLVLSLLLWRMIRADATGSKRDLTIVAALIGLAWQAHPSAATTGAALALYAAAHRKILGWRGLLARLALAAVCALGPILLLPLLASREPALMFGDPRNLDELRGYLLGSRFTGVPGVFGLAESRVASVGRFFWEETLGPGLLIILAGIFRLVRRNRRLLLGLAAWVLPVLAVTVLFKMEGQHDFWFVAAWLPLWVTGAVGLRALVGQLGERGPSAVAALGAAGLIWAAAANHADLNVRHYDLPESMGHLYLDPLDEGALLVVRSDNVYATTLFLQRIRGLRPDVAIVSISEVQDERGMSRLIARHPYLRRPEPALGGRNEQLAAFARANGAIQGHPLFFEVPPPAALLPSDVVLTPAGPMQRLVPKAGEPALDLRFWKEPVTAEQVSEIRRRERAQFNEYLPDGVRVRPETFEHRFLRDLLRGRKHLADRLARAGTADGFRRSAEIYESILKLDPWARDEIGAVYPLAGAYFGAKRYDLAEPWLKRALGLDPPPDVTDQLFEFLAVLCREQNRPEEAAAWQSRVRRR